MRDMENPRRLFEADEAPAELRGWLRQAQQDASSPAEVEQLVRSVECQMAAPAATVSGFRPMRGSRTTAKVLAALLAVGLGGGGWYLASQSSSSEPAPAELQLAKPQDPVVHAVPPTPEPPVAPAATSDEQALPPIMVKPRHLAHLRSRGSREGDTVHPTPVAAPTAEGATERSPGDEFALLRAARQAIEDRPERALALTSQHARLFPAGMLSQERETIAVEALVKLGRASQAQTRAHAFLAAHADSPYKSRVEAALARISAAQRSP
jgi:hypothetical protein